MGFLDGFTEFVQNASENAKRREEERFIRQCKADIARWEKFEQDTNREYENWKRDFDRKFNKQKLIKQYHKFINFLYAIDVF